MATSEALFDELRREIVRLRGALAYWLPHGGTVAPEDREAWVRHFALIAEDEVEIAPTPMTMAVDPA